MTIDNYGDVIVKKPWGYEYLVFENEHVAIWLLHIARKRSTSFHCHPKKITALLNLSGEALFKLQERELPLNAFDYVMIDKGVFHSTEASSNLPIIPQSENGIWVMEIESPPLKTDLVRERDNYGRAGSSYEGIDNMVFQGRDCINFKEFDGIEQIRKKFLNYTFTIKKCSGVAAFENVDDDSLVCVVGKEPEANFPIEPGIFMKCADLCHKAKHDQLVGCAVILVERSKTMVKVSDYIFSFIAALGVSDVFAVSGGGAMHLVDSLGGNSELNYIAVHHEQSAAMAAEGYARVSGKPGVVLVTSGPGGTNAITGVCGGWIDSIPMIVISGQVTSHTLIGDSGLRQFGIQESDIVTLVKSVTKYAVTVKDAADIKYHLQKAAHLAMTGRSGPVWLDIPLDVQSKLVDIEGLRGFVPEHELLGVGFVPELGVKVESVVSMLTVAKRPVLIVGNGVRLAHAEKEFLELADTLGIPVITSWTASDMIPFNHPLFVGRSGIMGDRAGNFTVQNADLILVVGSRMSIPQVGYNYSVFAREAKKIIVDIDKIEMSKPSTLFDVKIEADAKDFILMLSARMKDEALCVTDWVRRCISWKKKYPVCLPEYEEQKTFINSFYFVDVLAEKLGNEAVVVTDMGTSFTCTMQSFKIKSRQRLFTSSGHSSMGFGLPGAIGACFASHREKTICISGDGGLQMNIQELQTLVEYKLPVILFVLNNRGYLTIKLMQQNHFGRYVGSDPSSGVSCPDIIALAKAYGIDSLRVNNNTELLVNIDKILAAEGPFICEIMMAEDQPLIPRVSSLKKPDGTIISKPLEDLYPFLEREEFMSNMIVKPVEVLED